MSQVMINVSNLNVSFGANQVLHNINFKVAAGECYGLVGESGSGKSTILKAIMGLNKHTGTIEIENTPLVNHKRDKAFYRKVQMVFQDPYGSIHPKHAIDRILS